MSGQCRAVEQCYTAEEQAALGDVASLLGESTFDIYLTLGPSGGTSPAAVWGTGSVDIKL